MLKYENRVLYRIQLSKDEVKCFVMSSV